ATAPAAPSQPPAAPHAGEAGTAPTAPPSPAVGNRPEERVVLERDEQRFVLSSYGGTLQQARLKDARFLEHSGDPLSGHDVGRVQAAPGELPPPFPTSGFASPPDAAWVVARPAPDTVVFTADTDAVQIEKRYRLDPTRYRLQLDVVVHNKTSRQQD